MFADIEMIGNIDNSTDGDFRFLHTIVLTKDQIIVSSVDQSGGCFSCISNSTASHIDCVSGNARTNPDITVSVGLLTVAAADHIKGAVGHSSGRTGSGEKCRHIKVVQGKFNLVINSQSIDSSFAAFSSKSIFGTGAFKEQFTIEIVGVSSSFTCKSTVDSQSTATCDDCR